jgi:predicted HTH transcriptional regulator
VSSAKKSSKKTEFQAIRTVSSDISSDKGELQAINAVPSDISSDKTSDNDDFQAINAISSDKTNQKQGNKEKTLLDIFEDGLEHSVSELAEILGLSRPRTRAIVSSLVSQKKLTTIGANKNRKYQLSPINKEQ